jgi:motility quorum-sensing regulator/GCU-specific mRNA interferase toxin
MEKRKPSYDLRAIQSVLGSAEKLAMSVTARRNALQLGFDATGVVEVIRSIDRKMFQKSMTTYADSRVWQDVYHVRSSNLVLYVKFQADVVTEFMLVSFKEK